MENQNIYQFHYDWCLSTTLFYEDKSLIWEGIFRWSMLHNYYTHTHSRELARNQEL
jgi:hypothetical protein